MKKEERRISCYIVASSRVTLRETENRRTRERKGKETKEKARVSGVLELCVYACIRLYVCTCERACICVCVCARIRCNRNWSRHDKFEAKYTLYDEHKRDDRDSKRRDAERRC